MTGSGHGLASCQHLGEARLQPCFSSLALAICVGRYPICSCDPLLTPWVKTE